MYIIGLLFYIGVPIFAYYLESAWDFIVTSFELSPEITVLIGIAYIYPLSVFAMSVIFKNKGFANITYFRSQVTLSSTLAVSFGLIGTFIGLSHMISGIAAGMEADGDFSNKMASLLDAIGLALDSMSLAFLTSILGVGASVAILFSSNYLASFYRDNEHTKTNAKTQEGGSVPVFQASEETLQAFRNAQAEQVQVLEKQSEATQASMQNMVNYISESLNMNNYSMSEMRHAIMLMSETTRQGHDSLRSTINDTTVQLNAIANILHDLRVQMAIPLEESLANALRDKQIDLVYQVRKTLSGDVVGAEAYVRWTDPVRGLIPNSVLLEVAEKHGMLVELDRCVIDAAFVQISQWRSQGSWQNEQVLSINLSNKSLVDPGFLSYVEQQLEANSLMPELFAFEVTENTIMNYPEESRDKIRQIARLGIHVFIDDFGTGYSSLINLKNFNISQLKIDKAIVQNVLEYTDQRESVIRSIMKIANELNIQVSAEGIETQEQMDLLSSEGCSLFQGYFLGHPEKADPFYDMYLAQPTDS